MELLNVDRAKAHHSCLFLLAFVCPWLLPCKLVREKGQFAQLKQHREKVRSLEISCEDFRGGKERKSDLLLELSNAY